jgi:uncharacterized lipoprotein YajG
MVTRITAKFLAILAVVLLSGCAVPVMVSIATGAASVAVNETTGKTTTDHMVSAVNGKDCRVSRMGKENICQDERPEFKLTITTTSVKPSTIEEIESKYK